MAFVKDKFISSGIYNIINARENLSIISRSGPHNEERLTSSTDDDKWSIVLLADKKWQIRSQDQGEGPDLEPDAIEGDEILFRADHKAHSWVIKRCATASLDLYLIYSPSRPGLFWSLSDDNEGATLTLSRDDKRPSSWWKFRELERKKNDDEPDLGVERPTHSPGVVKNQVTIIIPPQWSTTVSAMSIGECINLIRVNRLVNGLLDIQDFISGWDSNDQPMVINESGINSYAIPAIDRHAVLTFEFFHSKNKRKKDPLDLPESGDLSSNLHMVTSKRKDTMQILRDTQTFWIFDESSTTRRNYAILNAHFAKNIAGVDLIDPGNPAPGTANTNFIETLDMPRPDNMMDYMTHYDIIFVVDDSTSMRGPHWAEVRLALTELSKEAMQYDAEGIEICFLNSKMHKQHIANPADMLEIFDTVQPRGWTYIASKLKFLLNRTIKKLDNAIGTPDYADIKPVEIVVITDGAPTDKPAAVIADAIERLDRKKHHLNAVGIQFLQIGNEDGAAEALQLLKNCPLRRMVDSVPYTKALTPQRLSEVLLGTLHPSIKSVLAAAVSTAVKECPICCSDDIPEYEYPRFPPTSRCEHKPLACRECIARHVEAQLFSQAIVLEISCPSHPCPEKLGYDEIKQWATQSCFQRYNSVALRQRLSEDPNFRWCLNVKCDHGQTHPLGGAFPVVQCSHCYKKSCFNHQLPWHEGLTCEQFDSLNPDMVASQEDAQRLIGSTTQQCTQCKKKIERSAGCDHMTCRCGHQFCWRCGATVSHDEIVRGSRNHLPTCPLRRR